MSRKSWALIAGLALLAGTVSCTRTGPPAPEWLPAGEEAPQEAPSAPEAAEAAPEVEPAPGEQPGPWEFEITRGMRKAGIEAVLGPPDHVGRDRLGREHRLHNIDGRWRGVLYDHRDRAVEWHP